MIIEYGSRPAPSGHPRVRFASDRLIVNSEAAATRSRAAAASNRSGLTSAVADAIDRAGPVVGDEDRAVLVEHDVGGAAEIALIAFEPAAKRTLPAWRSCRRGSTITRMIRAPWYLCRFQEPCSAIRMLFLYSARELIAGVELHAERRHMRAEIEHGRRELRALVPHRELVDPANCPGGNTDSQNARRSSMIMLSLSLGSVVAHPVAGVFGEPVFAGARIDVAADAVADAERIDFGVAGLGIDAADLRDAGRRNADVEGRSERQVEPCRPCRPAMYFQPCAA